MTISEQLKAWRKQERITQSQAARRLSTKLDTLQDWEQGRRQPRGLAKVALLERIRLKKPEPEPDEWA